MRDKLSKLISVMHRDGFFKTVGKAWKFTLAKYCSGFNFIKRFQFRLQRERVLSELDAIFSGKYNRVVVWRSRFGWNVPLFQRSQQIALSLSKKGCLVFYEVTRMTDKVDFLRKEREGLYLVDYEVTKFKELFFEKLKQIETPKYLQIYSTCWDIKLKEVDLYVENGFRLLYEYIDDLNPALAGTEDLPQNVRDIHSYVCSHKDALVAVSADRLYDDIVNKRGGNENVVFASNGVDLAHFTREKEKVGEMEKISSEYKKIVGYYGALAAWFDYETVKKLAVRFPSYAFVLIGIRYDTSLDESGLTDLPNVKYLGPVDYKKLPDYADYFDVAWIPFVINEITLATNPIKVFEYMALGKEIITSDMPECRKYASVRIAKDYDGYVSLLENAGQMTDEYSALLEKEAKENSWDCKADAIISLMEQNEK